MNNNIIV